MQNLKLSEDERGGTTTRVIADESPSFDACVRNFQRVGMSPDNAIHAVAKYKPKAYMNGVRPGVLPFKFWADDRGAIRFAEAQWDRVAKRACRSAQTRGSLR
jgi:hypothetical protein